MRGDVLV